MATALNRAELFLDLPDGWVNAWNLEKALLRCGDALGVAVAKVVIRFPAGCKLMIDVVIRLLSFCNQLIATTRRVRLEFAGGIAGVMGYLNRVGFFDCLAREADVVPLRPVFSGAVLHRGGNQGLVEIERFNRSAQVDAQLPDRLARAVHRGCAGRHDAGQISSAVASIFSELIGNVFEHSQTSIDAYAALQTYPQGNRVTVAVSDSGVGLMQTLRPALARQGSPHATMNDVDLLVQIFREGVSSLEDDKRGQGLRACARSAIRFGADLDVRLPNQRVLLRPADGDYRPNTAYTLDGLPLVWGTHIAFSLNLS